jgi:hypothetical protein
MNLKLVVASMSILGLVSCPVLAASKHKHHHRVAKQVSQVEATEYKDMGALPAVQACTISQSAMIMDDMSQNIGRSMPSPCNPGWFNRVQLSGGINVDLGKFGNRNQNFMGENYQRLSLNDVYLNMAANINDWTKGFASISYNTATIVDPIEASTPTFHAAEYDAAYSNNVSDGSTSTMQIEQAYMTFGNFEVSPIFVQIGKQFQDYGRYTIHPITENITQVLTQTLATSAKVGFLAGGFNGSLAVFDDQIAKVGQTNKPTDYVLALGYNMPSDQFGLNIGAAYIYDLMGVNNVAWSVNQFNAFNAGPGFNSRIGAAAAYADMNSGPFVLGLRYTTAVQRFNVADLPKNGVADLTSSGTDLNNSPTTDATGAKPYAASIQAGYGFEGWSRNQNVYAGYQMSRQAAGLNVPRSRYLVGYGIDLMGKNTNVGIEWDRDMAYSVSNGGTGRNGNLVSIRTAVQFG